MSSIDDRPPVLTSGTATTYREGITIHHLQAADGRLNSRYSHVHGASTREGLRRRIREFIVTDGPGWLTHWPHFDVTVRADPMHRGRWHWTVYGVPAHRARNLDAAFHPATVDEPDTLPCLELAGVQVYAYVAESGELHVSVDLDGAEPGLADVHGAVPLRVSVQGAPVFDSEFEREAEVIRMAFDCEMCAECGADLDAHTIRRDPLGHAYAHCHRPTDPGAQ